MFEIAAFALLARNDRKPKTARNDDLIYYKIAPPPIQRRRGYPSSATYATAY